LPLKLPWPSGAEFYRERDDRTARNVTEIDRVALRPVELHIDPAAAEDAGVQIIALVAANLTARWARRIQVVLPVTTPLAEVLRRDGATTLAERLMAEMRAADPFGVFAIAATDLEWLAVDKDACHAIDAADSVEAEAAPIRLFIGPWDALPTAGGRSMSADYQIQAMSWTALGRRLTDPAAPQRSEAAGETDMALRAPATVAAAGLAGALGAADLFKRAVGHPAEYWMPTFAWDTWSSHLEVGAQAWSTASIRSTPTVFDWGETLLAGAGAIGSAFVYLADLMPQTGRLAVLDRDHVEVSNLNRSPMFTVSHAIAKVAKAELVADYLEGRNVAVEAIVGTWREHADVLAAKPFDVWVSLTNEDGAWAEQPFQLPPVVFHATTTSGWGISAGRHVPRLEDCTLCRMPRPTADFRGPCAEGEIAVTADAEPIRASLPFLSTAAAALAVAMYLQLQEGRVAISLPNDVGADLGVGLPCVSALARGASSNCRGCQAALSGTWKSRGGRGRFSAYSRSVRRLE
jgi:hypothetical protein